jgi:serine phosphatase RsbU (regulator of sigma subunit)
MEHEKFINSKNRNFELNESTVHNEQLHRKQIKILLPSQRHREIQRKLMKKYLLAIQRPQITDHDRHIAYQNAKTYLKRFKNDLERRSRGLSV